MNTSINILTISAFFLLACILPAQQWNQGGTLYSKTVSDWKAATSENKLATCADLVASANLDHKYNSMQELKNDALKLVILLDEAAEAAPDSVMISTLVEQTISQIRE